MRFTRRDFLKWGAYISAAVATLARPIAQGSRAMELLMGGVGVSRTTEKKRLAVPTTCLQCYARCGITGYSEYGRLRKIGGNLAHPNSRGKLCAKGQAGINFLYDPGRILKPLRRKSDRGSGQWQKISWEEAWKEISEKLGNLRSKGLAAKLAILSERDITTGNIAKRFLNAYGSPHLLGDSHLSGLNKRLALEMTMGFGVEINDVAYTQYMLNFGANPYEANILRTSFVQRIIEGRQERVFDKMVHMGAKLVTFDVRLSQTAGRSDEWHPIFPGTDATIALAMANVIMQEDLYDKAFLKKWLNYPIQELKNHLAQYSPEMAHRISGVSADIIRRLAREFGSIKPANAITSGGLYKHVNGFQNERAVLLLNIITGNIDNKGGFCLPKNYELMEPEPKPKELVPDVSISKAGSLLSQHNGHSIMQAIQEGTLELEALIIYMANPVYSFPHNEQVKTILKDKKKLPFVVVMESHMSETAAIADLILPAATYLERWELESPPSFEMIPFVSLRQPVVKPLGECMAYSDILTELAKRLGDDVGRFFPFRNAEDYVSYQIQNIPKLVDAGGIDHLRETGLWIDPTHSPRYQTYMRGGFQTPSKKIEIYSIRLKQKGISPLPEYVPIPDHQSLKSDELILTTFQWNTHTHYNTAGCMWLAEITHENAMWIHPETARSRGIKDGDRVSLRSKAGIIETKVRVTWGIHPKVVALSDSCGHWKYGGVAQARKFKSYNPNTQLIWWESEGNGVHPNAIIPVQIDPASGGQGWMDTVVTIKKLL